MCTQIIPGTWGNIWSPAAKSAAPLVRQLVYIWSWQSWGQERPWLDKLCLMVSIQQEGLSPQMSCRVGCPGVWFAKVKAKIKQKKPLCVMSLWLPHAKCCRCQQRGSRISRVGKVKVQTWTENPQCSFLSHPCVTAVLPFIFSINQKRNDRFSCLGRWFANWWCSLRWWMVSGNTSLQKQDNSLYLSSTLDLKCLEIHIIREKWGWEKRILTRSSDLPFCPTYNASDRCLPHLFLTPGYGDSSLSLKPVCAVRKLSLMSNLNLLSGYWSHSYLHSQRAPSNGSVDMQGVGRSRAALEGEKPGFLKQKTSFMLAKEGRGFDVLHKLSSLILLKLSLLTAGGWARWDFKVPSNHSVILWYLHWEHSWASLYSFSKHALFLRITAWLNFSNNVYLHWKNTSRISFLLCRPTLTIIELLFISKGKITLWSACVGDNVSARM